MGLIKSASLPKSLDETKKIEEDTKHCQSVKKFKFESKILQTLESWVVEACLGLVHTEEAIEDQISHFRATTRRTTRRTTTTTRRTTTTTRRPSSTLFPPVTSNSTVGTNTPPVILPPIINPTQPPPNFSPTNSAEHNKLSVALLTLMSILVVYFK